MLKTAWDKNSFMNSLLNVNAFLLKAFSTEHSDENTLQR